MYRPARCGRGYVGGLPRESGKLDADGVVWSCPYYRHNPPQYSAARQYVPQFPNAEIVRQRASRRGLAGSNVKQTAPRAWIHSQPIQIGHVLPLALFLSAAIALHRSRN